MSRVYDDYDGDEQFPNEWAFWERRTRQVLTGRPGKKALAELREALLALPEKRLISGALSTAGKADQPASSKWYEQEHRELLNQGEGVCAVGAFVWYQRVKAGEDPQEAMRAIPLAPDYDGDPEATVNAGKAAGLTYTLAWVLMQRNDSDFEHMTPEERYDAYLAWLDEKLAEPAAAAS